MSLQNECSNNGYSTKEILQGVVLSCFTDIGTSVGDGEFYVIVQSINFSGPC